MERLIEKLKLKRDELYKDWIESGPGPTRIRLEYYRKYQNINELIKSIE